jgi:hypothetical protein
MQAQRLLDAQCEANYHAIGKWSVPVVEGLYCKRPIQCLASSELLTPRPGWRGVGGSIVRKTPDTALYSIYVSTLWCQSYIRIPRNGGGGSLSTKENPRGLRDRSSLHMSILIGLLT